MKRSMKRIISLVLSFIMILSVCPVTTLAADGENLLSVEQDLVATVSYGTALEDAIAELPANVTGKVKDISPLSEVETLNYDFNDNVAPADWTLLSDKITFSDGAMVFGNDPNIKAVVGDAAMTDYVVQADLQILEGTPTADVGIMFRSNDATDKNADSYNGYYAGIGVLDVNDAEAGRGVKIGYADGGWHMVGSKVIDIDATNAYTLKIVVYENQYFVFLKDAAAQESEFELVYSGTQDLYANGYVGLRSYKQSFSGDNFVVRSLTDADLAECGIVRTKDVTLPVTKWTSEGYDGDTAGRYEAIGTIDCGDAYANPDNLTAKATITVKSAPEQIDHVHSVPFSQVTVEDSYWSARQKQFICQVIPVAISNISTGTGGMVNFKVASEYLATKEGNYTTDDAPAHSGAIYVDSDDYKVIEAMCYALQLDANGDEEILAGQAAILAQLEEWIPWIVGSQEADGYLYTPYTLTKSSAKMRFNGRSDDMPVHTDGSLYDTVGNEQYNAEVHLKDNHELYCAGHFYEAAVAHYRATGDFRLLDVAVKNADLVVRTFGYEEGQVYGVPGHQEIELALIKLANLCEEIGVANGVDYASKAEGYIAAAKFFLDARGDSAAAYDGINATTAQYQAEAPVTEQTTAHGHAVRAQYMYTAMADVALLEMAAGNENPYDTALQTIYQDALTKQYITGGIGVKGAEAFSNSSYYLPNDNAYCETCAQISNVMWNQRMNLLYGDSDYTDKVEWVLYNSVMSCINLDGDRFFYQNHMNSDSDWTRSKWFGTACCPPNLMRTVAAIGGYIYTQDAEGNVTVDQYIGNTADLNIGGNLVNISMTGSFPWDGDASLTVNKTSEEAFSISFRIPSWATYGNKITLNGEEISAEPNEKGYVVIDRVWAVGDKVELTFQMEAERIYSDPNVVENEGLVAVSRGPIIYCAESSDNEGVAVRSAVLPTDAELVVSDLQQLPGRENEDHYNVEKIRLITYEGTYGTVFGNVSETSLTLIPYYAWNNRGYSDMTVYLIEDDGIDTEHPLEYYATPSASFTDVYGSSPAHLNNGNSDMVNSSVSDRWSSYGAPTNENWVEYAFEGEVILRGSWISWYDDAGGVQVPTGLTIKYWDGEAWQDVTNLTGTDYFPKNNFNNALQGEAYYGFDEITTTKIRLYPTNPNTTSTKAQPGIIEWRLDGEIANNVTALPKEYEAENGTVAGITDKGYVRNVNISANGYAATIDNAEATVTMEVYAPVAGVYDMLIKYSGHTDYPNAAHKYYANGDLESAQLVTYDNLKGWLNFNWTTTPARIALEEGKNTITFTHSGLDKSFARLDVITLRKADVATKVIELIDAIGEVTLESGEAVMAAKEAYDALPASEKERVTNTDVLVDAVQTYTILVAEDYANKAAESAEAAQKAYEDAVAAAEEAKAQVAEDKAAAEAAQAEAEAAKVAAEEAQMKAEAAKEAAEAAKAAAEENNTKAAEEAAKAAQEAAKAAADAAKVAELSKAVAEAQAKTQEAQAKAEAAQKAAEEAQKAAEEAEKLAATDKAAAEVAKAEAEAAEKAAKAAEAEAIAAQKNAEAAQKEAEAAQKAAAAEKDGAEAAKAEAEAAKEAAKAAKEEAEAARAEAEAEKAEAEAAKEAAEKAKAEAIKEAEKAKAEAELATAKCEALMIVAAQSDLIDSEELTKHQLTEYKNAINDAINAIMTAEDEESVDAAIAAMEEALDAALAVCPAAKFVDIDLDEWYHESIDYVASNGYMTGTGEDTFGPFDNTSRAMLVTILYRIAGAPDVEGLEAPFEDTLADVWYSDAVIWGYNEGIVTGYDEATFAPDDAINREQLVTMLYRYAEYMAENVTAEAELDGFADAASVSEYAQNAMKWAVANEILTGKAEGTLIDPQGNAARVECAAIIARMLNK